MARRVESDGDAIRQMDKARVDATLSRLRNAIALTFAVGARDVVRLATGGKQERVRVGRRKRIGRVPKNRAGGGFWRDVNRPPVP